MTMRLWRNGVPVQVEDVGDLAFAGFAHFTAMQVRAGAVRGLDLHLDRLRSASRELFGRDLDEETLRHAMRRALAAGPPDRSMIVTVRAAEGEFVPADPTRALDVVVGTGAPSDGPVGPLRLDIVEHERFLPHVKHVGEGAKTFHLHAAQRRGYDDAVFLDRSGRIGEATIWNLAFFDGKAVVWPVSDVLAGTTMGIVRRQLARVGVHQEERELRPEELDGLAAVLMNSWTPAVPVAAIGDRELERDPGFERVLREAFAAETSVLV